MSSTGAAGRCGPFLAGMAALACAFPAAAQPPSDTPFPPGIHRQLIERVTTSESGEYAEILGEFDRHLGANPDDFVAAVERCRFITNYAYQEEATIESAYEDSEACIAELSAESYASSADVKLFLLEQGWGEEAIAEAEELLKGAQEWTPAQQAALHSRLFSLHAMNDADKSGQHAIAAIELDPATGLQLGAAEYLIRIGAKRKAIAAIRTLPVDQWNVWSLQEAVRLVLLAGDPKAAFELVTERPQLELNRSTRWALVRALFDAGDRKSGDTLLAAADKLPASGDESAYPDRAAMRELFALRRDYGTDSEAIKAYDELRDSGWRADPFGWYRLSLIRAGIAAPVKLRDLLGPGALILALAFAALLPALVIVPMHYRGLVRRLRGHQVPQPSELAPWGLRHAWYAVGSLLVAMSMCLYLFAPDYFESEFSPIFDSFSYVAATVDDIALGKSALWGGVIGLVALIPLVRRTTLRSLLATRWSMLRSLLGGFGLALAFLVIAGLLRGIMMWTCLAIGVGSDTVRSMQGIEQAYGPLAMFGFVALLVPVVEEFVFRGVLLRASARHVALWAAVLIQALTFALWHEEPTDYPIMFVFALATAWLALRSGGLLAPVTFHATVNVLAAIQVLIVGRVLSQAV